MKNVALIFVLLLVSAGSFYAGSRIGVREHHLADAQYRAAVAVGNLRLIELNRMDDLRTVLEINLNGDIARYGDYLDSNWKWLWPELRATTPRAIKSAIDYRVSHPFTEPDLGDPKNIAPGVSKEESFVREVIEGQKQNAQQIERVIRELSSDGA